MDNKHRKLFVIKNQTSANLCPEIHQSTFVCLAAGLCHWAIGLANALSRPFSLNGRGLLLKGRKGRTGGERGRKGREGNPPPSSQGG